MTPNKKGSPIHAIFRVQPKVYQKGFDSVDSESWRTKIYKTENQRNGVSNLCLVSFEQGIPAQQKYSIHIAKRIISYAQIFDIILASHYQPLCTYTKDQLSQRPVARLSTERILICKGSTTFKHIRNIPQCRDVSRVLTGILQQVHSFPNHVPSEFNRI